MPSDHRKTRSVVHCQFPFSDGRRCTLPVSPGHPRFCLTHALRERRQLGAEQIAAELAAMSTRIRTASDLNYFLTRLVFYTASQRIPKGTARTLAYLASLLLQTIRSVKNEVTIAHGFREWQELLRQTVPDAYADSRSSGDPSAAPEPSAGDTDNFADPDAASAGAEYPPRCREPRNSASQTVGFPSAPAEGLSQSGANGRGSPT